MSLDAPYLMHVFSYDLQLAPSRIKLDFKTTGGTSETKEWHSLQKYNSSASDNIRYIGQPGYDTHCAQRFQFSWEKESTCITG